jgi:multiple sugar transport system permease protein
MKLNRKQRAIAKAIVVYFLTGTLVAFAALPMAWMLSTSLKTTDEQFLIPPRWIPENPTLNNYAKILNPNLYGSGGRFTVYFNNSMIISIASTILSVLVSVPAAYAFSRFKFPGKDVAYFAVLVRNMFPLIVFLIPIFVMMRILQLQNTLSGLVLAYLTFTLPLAIWLLKGFLDGIPRELELAARIDGCTRFGAFVRIILPLTAPGLAATAIYAFVQAWNEFAFARTLTESAALRTLPVGLSYFFTENRADWGGLMAAAFLFSIPVVIVFMILQRFFIAALTQGAVKQ